MILKQRAIALGFGVMFGIGVASGLTVATADDQGTYKSLDLFAKVFEQVRESYVEEVSEKDLIEAAIQGMLRSLDPHSAYLNEDDSKAMRTSTLGEFGGLGIEVTMENGFVKVVSPIDETPAYRAGLKAGDYITHLDGEPVQGLTLDEAVERMRGLVGEDIQLTVAREGVDPFDVTITRDKIKIQSVRQRIEAGNVGYIRISSFNQQTQPGLDKAIKRLNEEAENGLVGFILDLRNNPGGLLGQAISVSDTFLKQGLIVSTRGRGIQNASDYRAGNDSDDANGGDSIEGLPLVVLINGGSASASEIVAGALQDHGRAILVGTKTFGKGSVQSLIQLTDKEEIKLTTQRYYTPSGKSIQAKGIEPDIVVEQARLEKLNNNFRSEADLRNSLENEDGSAQEEGEADNAESGNDTPQDYQLARAVDLIKAIGLYRGMTETQ